MIKSTGQFLTFDLLWSKAQDGYSHYTFYERAQLASTGQTLLVIKDKLGYVFGAFLASDIRQEQKFAGDSDAFVFTFKTTEDMQIWDSTGENHNY